MNLTKKGTGSVKQNVLKAVTNDTLGSTFLFILMFVIMAVADDAFLSQRNLLNLMRQSSFYVIVALGMVVAVISGGLDFSAGGTMGVAGILAAIMAREGWNPVLIFVLATAVGAFIGCINGFLIGYLRLPNFIICLAMQYVLRGSVTLITGGYPVNDLSDAFVAVGTSSILGIPVPVWAMLVLCFVTWYMLNRTVYGRHLYAAGCNRQAAIVSGINASRVQLLAYVYCGAMAALAGILLTSRMMSGQTATGTGYELMAIAGVVIGGGSFKGGKGTVLGAVFGMMVIRLMNNAFTLLNLNAYWQQVAQGLIIIFAMLLDLFRMKLRNRIKN